MGWLKREWEIQWPLVRFELYKWGAIVGGGAVIAIGAKLLHGVLRIPDAYFYGSLFVISSMCFIFFGSRFNRVHERQTNPALPPPATIAAQTEEMSLQDRLAELSKGIFGFLGKCGVEEPVPSLGYIVKVHDGFMLSWYNQVETIAYELGASGIVDFELSELLTKNKNIFSYDVIRQIAETLLKVKSKLELKSYKAPHTDNERHRSYDLRRVERANERPAVRQTGGLALRY